MTEFINFVIRVGLLDKYEKKKVYTYFRKMLVGRKTKKLKKKELFLLWNEEKKVKSVKEIRSSDSLNMSILIWYKYATNTY